MNRVKGNLLFPAAKLKTGAVEKCLPCIRRECATCAEADGLPDNMADDFPKSAVMALAKEKCESVGLAFVTNRIQKAAI